MESLRRNIPAIYWMSFFQSAMLVTAVFVPLLQRHGLSMSQVFLTQALFALVIAGLEVPSGYLADIWGRRNTLVLGQALTAASFLLLVTADGFGDFLLYEAVIGTGLSLCSGANLALLYDSQRAVDEADGPAASTGRAISRLVAIESYGGAAAAIAASLLTLGSLDWVLWAQAGVGGLAFACALRLTEAPRDVSTAGHLENFRRVARGLLDAPVVCWTALAIVLFGLSALLSFWISQKYWELEGVPLACFGWLWAVHCLTRAAAAHYAQDLERLLGWRLALAGAALLPLLGFFGMGLGAGVAGVLFGLAFPLGRGLSLVILYDALNKRLDADFRATLNSLVSLGTRALFIAAGPLLGLLVDARGSHLALLVLGALFLPAAAAVLLPLARRIAAEEMHARPEADRLGQAAGNPP